MKIGTFSQSAVILSSYSSPYKYTHPTACHVTLDGNRKWQISKIVDERSYDVR
jgi:hypothetical protein